jgi:hypothetical protein
VTRAHWTGFGCTSASGETFYIHHILRNTRNAMGQYIIKVCNHFYTGKYLSLTFRLLIGMIQFYIHNVQERTLSTNA